MTADLTGSLDAQLDEAQALAHTDPQRAAVLAERVIAAATAADDAATSARAEYTLARLCAERGDLTGALALVDRARSDWERSGDPVSAARTDLGRMQILDDLGRHREAAAIGRRLLETLAAFPADVLDDRARQLLRAAALDNVGVARSFLGDHVEALAAYTEAEEIYLRFDVLEQVAQPRANQGIELLALGRAREARDLLLSARDAFAELGDPLWAAKCAGHLGEAHAQLGELVSALRVLADADVVLRDLGATAEQGRIQLGLARTYLAAGLHGEAFGTAVEAARTLASAGLRHDEGFARFVAALAAFTRADLSGAADELDLALVIFAEVDDRQYLARSFLLQAELAAGSGRRQVAAELIDRVVAMSAHGGWRITEVRARLTQVDLADGDAERWELLRAVQPLVDVLDLPSIDYAYGLRMARAERARGEGVAAERRLRSILLSVDEGTATLPDPTLRLAFLGDRRDASDELVDLLVVRGRAGDVEQAQRISDLSKVRTLLEVRTGTLGRSDAPTRDELATQRLRADLTATHSEIVRAGDRDEVRVLRDRVRVLERELTALRVGAAVREERGVPAPVATGTATVDGTAISYHIVGADIVAFAQRNGETTCCRLVDALPRVRTSTDELTGQWLRARLTGDRGRHAQRIVLESTRQVLGELHDVLWAPVVDVVGDLDGPVTVVPHRLLHNVPFHALHDGQAHLVERHVVSLMPSLVSSVAAHRRPSRPRAGMLAVGVADDRAPRIAQEIERIVRTWPEARVLTDAAATVDAFARHAPDAAIIHLACHGLYRPDNPLFSALKFVDRWLSGTDVLDVDLTDALVTLSACESGRSSSSTAEPVGLAWSFLAAGASDVIVSQWLLDDDAAGDLMSEFYRRLRDGCAPAEALQQAQVEAARDGRHPYYWAPFAHVRSAGWAPVDGVGP